MSQSTCTILIADDDALIRDDLAEVLRVDSRGFLFSATAAETWRIVSQQQPDLVLLDLKFPDAHDLNLLRKIKQHHPDIEVIIISSQSENVSQIVEAIKIGAFDFVAKPFEPVELRNRASKALDMAALRKAQNILLKDLTDKAGVDSMIGNSAPMAKVRESLARLAALDGCVLIQGESGTGKELAARAIHFWGTRKTHPFVSVNCAAIPETLVESVLFGHKKGAFTGAHESVKGRFEAAGEGTVFLDEIGDMPLPQQASLLRVLEYRRFTPIGETAERHCRARFVLATNRDLRESVRKGNFREDLFFRINVANIVMPPLRSRIDDISTLATYYCDRFSAEMGRRPVSVAPETLNLLSKYDWPGNIRELKNMLEAAIMMGDPGNRTITQQELPAEILASVGDTSGEMTAGDIRDKRLLLEALRDSNGNQSEAAKILGWHRNTVRNKMKSFGIAGSAEDAS